MRKIAIKQSQTENKPQGEKVPFTFMRLPEIEMIAVPKDFARDHSISHLARSILLDWLSRPRESELSVETIMIRFGLHSALARAVFLEIKGTKYVR